jgi:tetratricopeptide (TPR) repeat protein
MRNRLVLLMLALLCGCAAAPQAPSSPAPLFDDAKFTAPAAAPPAPAEVFAISDEMRAYLHTRAADWMRRHGKQRGLLEALYTQSELKLQYDATLTRTAAEAFAARSGNCLSLVLMTAAFAKEIGLQIEYQSAYTDETWSRSGELYFRSGHVNITLGRRLTDLGARSGDTTHWTVDFLPRGELRGLRTRVIDEAEVVAMYYNNRAAELLAAGRVGDAYWWARAAIAADPRFLAGYNTLGVVYQRRGLPAQAERVFATVIERDPGHTRAMHNLVQVLGDLGRNGERDALAARLVRLEPDPPYRFFELGQRAWRNGDYRAARDWFAKEVARADYSHEFHFWLAVAHYQLGEIDDARRHLQLAVVNSATPGERALYAGKLARLKSASPPSGN